MENQITEAAQRATASEVREDPYKDAHSQEESQRSSRKSDTGSSKRGGMAYLMKMINNNKSFAALYQKKIDSKPRPNRKVHEPQASSKEQSKIDGSNDFDRIQTSRATSKAVIPATTKLSRNGPQAIRHNETTFEPLTSDNNPTASQPAYLDTYGKKFKSKFRNNKKTRIGQIEKLKLQTNLKASEEGNLEQLAKEDFFENLDGITEGWNQNPIESKDPVVPVAVTPESFIQELVEVEMANRKAAKHLGVDPSSKIPMKPMRNGLKKQVTDFPKKETKEQTWTVAAKEPRSGVTRLSGVSGRSGVESSREGRRLTGARVQAEARESSQSRQESVALKDPVIASLLKMASTKKSKRTSRSGSIASLKSQKSVRSIKSNKSNKSMKSGKWSKAPSKPAGNVRSSTREKSLQPPSVTKELTLQQDRQLDHQQQDTLTGQTVVSSRKLMEEPFQLEKEEQSPHLIAVRRENGSKISDLEIQKRQVSGKLRPDNEPSSILEKLKSKMATSLPAPQGEQENSPPMKEGKLIKIKKNQIDPTAGFFYCLGSSLTHLALFFAIFFVKWPNLDRAEEFDEEFKTMLEAQQTSLSDDMNYKFCQGISSDLSKLMKEYVIIHVLCFVITFYREIFEAKLDTFGQFMKAIEVMGLILYFRVAFLSLNLFTTWKIADMDPLDIFTKIYSHDHQVENVESLLEVVKTPPGLASKKAMEEFTGKSLEWVFMELIVFVLFFLTMGILMLKSRFRQVGIDNSYQFEPQYMSHMANYIVSDFDFDFEEVQRSKLRQKNYFTMKPRNLFVQGVPLKVQFAPDDYDQIYQKAYFGEARHFIGAEEAPEWIKSNVSGSITKQELEAQRMGEVNALDMMQNSSIIYHSESILETQTFCLVSCLYMFYQTSDGHGSDTVSLAYILLGEHLLSYIAHFYREYDIKKNGTLDVHGVLRAPRESILQLVQIFGGCILIGFVISHLLEKGRDEFHRDAYLTYWIIVDSILIFLLQLYGYLSQKMKLHSEILKNISTIFFVQQNKLRAKDRSRRESQLASDRQEHDTGLEADGEEDQASPSSPGKNNLISAPPSPTPYQDQVELTEEPSIDDLVKTFNSITADPFPVLTNPDGLEAEVGQQEQPEEKKVDQKDQNQDLVGYLEDPWDASRGGDPVARPETEVSTHQTRPADQKLLTEPESLNFDSSLSHLLAQSRMANSNHANHANHASKGKDTGTASEGEQLQNLLREKFRARLLKDDDSEEDLEASVPSDGHAGLERPLSFISTFKDQFIRRLSSIRTQVHRRNLAEERQRRIKDRLETQEKEALSKKTILEEKDFLEEEAVEIQMDVYNLTIAALMTGTCTPMQVNYSIRMCFTVFILQVLIAVFFTWDVKDLDNFQHFDMTQGAVRIICAQLLQMTLYQELQKSLKLLAFLKRQGKTLMSKNRGTCILLCSLQILTPIAVLGALMVTMGQENQFSMIIKLYITLGYIITIDNLFAENLPKEIIKNAIVLNDSKVLLVGEDHNTFSKIVGRLKTKRLSCSLVLSEACNLLINIWYFLMTNFQIIVFNYFAAFLGILIQFIGFNMKVDKMVKQPA